MSDTEEAGFVRRVTDGFSNLASRVGLKTNNQHSASGYDYSYITRDRAALEAAYTNSWVVGRGVDVYAEDMTRAGIDLRVNLPPDKVDALHKGLRDVDFWGAAREAITWARLYGGALMVALIDGQNVSTPLDTRRVRIGQFRGFAVLDRWQVSTFGETLIQQLGPDLGKPEFYRVAAGCEVFPGQRIHHSRVIRIEGIRLPARRRMAEQGWGMSIVERLYERALALDSATMGMGQLVYKSHLRTMKIKGYKTAVAIGGDALNGILKSIDMIRLMQSNEGLTVIDDADSLETQTYTFGGLPDVIDKLLEQVCGALQIPAVRLIGQSPKGFSTGETDLQNHDDGIHMEQESKLRRGVMFALELVSQSGLGRPLPEGADFGFTPLRQMTLGDKVDVAAKGAAAVVDAFDKQVIGRKQALQELRAMSPLTGLFSNITDEDIEAAESEPPSPDEALAPGEGEGEPDKQSDVSGAQPEPSERKAANDAEPLDLTPYLIAEEAAE